MQCTSCPSSTGNVPEAGFVRENKRLPRDSPDLAAEARCGGCCSRQHRLPMGLIVGLYATVALMSLRPVRVNEPTAEVGPREARPATAAPVKTLGARSANMSSQPHVTRRAPSRRSCAELRRGGGGWPARASAVCSDVLSSGGTGPRPWSITRKACESAGARLCSGAEVAAGVLRGVGIVTDSRSNASAVWTSTSCGSGASYLAMRHASSAELSALLGKFDTDANGRLTKQELKAVGDGDGAPRRATGGAVRCEAGTGLQHTACCADEG